MEISLKSFSVVICSLLISMSVFGQSIKVLDESVEPLRDAHIAYKTQGRWQLAFSGLNGRATLTGIEENTEIRVSLLGYQSDTLVWRGVPIDVVLQKADFDLSEVVITAQYGPVRKSESVHSVRIIGSEEIEQRAAVTLDDVLRNELNFRVTNDNILGTGLSMQGISGENVKIMVDGVPVVGRLNGNIDLSQLNLNRVERIEIIEGPLAVNYGSNALAGTINLITKSPRSEETSLEGSFFTESIGHFNANASVSHGWNKQSLTLSGGRNFFDGWNPGDDFFYDRRSGVADETRVQQWNPREQIFADAKYRLALPNGYIEGSGSFFHEEIINRGSPSGAYGERAFDDYYRTRRYGGSVKYESGLGGNWNTHHLAAYNVFGRTKSTYITDLTGVSSEISPNPSLQDTSAFHSALARGSFIGRVSEVIELQVGYEAEIETAEGERIVDDTGMIGNYALFATSEFKPVDRMVIKPGLRLAYNTRFDAPLIPSINLLYEFRGNLEARFSYAQGFRAPGLKELSFYFVDINHNIVGNESLEAEKSHNVSGSVAAAVGDGRKVGWEISGFYNRIFNLITLAQVADLEFSYINLGERETSGGRAEANTTIGDLTLAAGLSCTAISNDLSSGKEFTFTPEANFRLGYEFGDSGLSTHLFYKFNGRQPLLVENEEGEVVEEFINSFQNLDVTLSKTFSEGRFRWELGGRNLLNVQNVSASVAGGAHSGGGSLAIGTGRTIFTRLSISIVK